MHKSKKLRRISKWANRGYVEAQYILGLAFLEGDGVSQNEERGLYYLTLAADNGYEDAVVFLNGYYFDDDALTQAES